MYIKTKFNDVLDLKLCMQSTANIINKCWIKTAVIFSLSSFVPDFYAVTVF